MAWWLTGLSESLPRIEDAVNLSFKEEITFAEEDI